jgi:hypothetical protein
LRCITQSGRYFTNGKVNVDIKMAGKLVPVKRNPVILHDVSIYNTTKVQVVPNPKPPKNDKVVVRLADSGTTPIYPWTIECTPVDKGRYVFRLFTSHHEVSWRQVFGLWDTEKFAATEDYSAMRKITLMGRRNYIRNVSFNDKFVVATYVNPPEDVEYLVIDLRQSCQHNKLFKKTNNLYIEYSEQELCPVPKCTIIERGSLKTAIRQVYASQLVPEKIVMFCCPAEANAHPLEVVVWTHGKTRQSAEITVGSICMKKFVGLSEHVAKCQRRAASLDVIRDHCTHAIVAVRDRH